MLTPSAFVVAAAEESANKTVAKAIVAAAVIDASFFKAELPGPSIECKMDHVSFELAIFGLAD